MAGRIQGVLIILLGVLGIIDGVSTSLSVRRENPRLYDMVGPDRWVIAVGLGLLILGILYSLMTYRKRIPVSRLVPEQGRAALLLTIGVLVAYGALLQYLGYVAATLAFFLAIFRIMGVTSWRTVAMLSVVSTATYYLFFVHVAGVVFPHGLLLGLWG